MSNLTVIVLLSAIVWYCVDRFKAAWVDKPYGKYITTAAAGLLGAIMVFGYNLDLISAMGIVPEVTFAGKIITTLSIMSGSSAIAEIIERIKGC